MLSWFSKIFGGAGKEASSVGGAVVGVAEVFVANKTKRDKIEGDAFNAVVDSHRAEFASVGNTWFDSLINGINRLPRPIMALGVIAMFVFAIKSPQAFAERMIGITVIPEPMWWLIGVVVAFYFGARETHHARMGTAIQSISTATRNFQDVQAALNDGTVDKSKVTEDQIRNDLEEQDAPFTENAILDQLNS